MVNKTQIQLVEENNYFQCLFNKCKFQLSIASLRGNSFNDSNIYRFRRSMFKSILPQKASRPQQHIQTYAHHQQNTGDLSIIWSQIYTYRLLFNLLEPNINYRHHFQSGKNLANSMAFTVQIATHFIRLKTLKNIAIWPTHKYKIILATAR